MHLRRIAPALAMILAFPAHAGSSGLPIGGGLEIPLEGSWKFSSMENFAMRMPDIRKLIADAREIRVRRPETGILVSYMKIKADKDTKVPSESELIVESNQSVGRISSVYLAHSIETDAKPLTVANAGVVVSLVTLHAKEGDRFRVADGYPGGCVTTGAIRRGVEVWSISVASESCESESHKTALRALFAPKTH